MKCLTLVIVVALGWSGLVAAAEISAPGGWTTAAPRDEVRPLFSYQSAGGHADAERLIIQADAHEGLSGQWQKSLPVTGGKYYRFQAWRKTENIDLPRRAGVARVLWRDKDGKPVTHDEPSFASYSPGTKPRAEPEYP